MTIDRMIELLGIERMCMLRKSHDGCDSQCGTCDLVQDDGELYDMYTSVINVLLSQKPRMLTLEEVLVLEEGTLVYIENKNYLCGWETYRKSDGKDVITGNPWTEDEYWTMCRYGKTWRVWTSKPTDAQMKAVKWE